MRFTIASTMLGLAGPAISAVASHSAPVARDFDPSRLANDATWNKFKCKGELLISAMEGIEEEAAKLMNLPAAQSPWAGGLQRQFALTCLRVQSITMLLQVSSRYGATPKHMHPP